MSGTTSWKRHLRPLRLMGPLLFSACALEGTTEPPMDVSNFDPIKGLEAARRFAGPDSELLGFEARFVRSNGTMDLTASYQPSLSYEFVRPNRNQQDAPVGTGKSDRAYELIEIDVHEPRWVHVKRFGGGCSGSFHDEGMKRDVGLTGHDRYFQRTSPPGCDLATVWKLAREAKSEIPENAVATIEFNGAGYHFEISDLKVELWFSPSSCEPIDQGEFWARESELATPPDRREEQARRRIEARKQVEAEKAEREAEEKRLQAEREKNQVRVDGSTGDWEKARQEALQRLRERQARQAK